MEKLYNGIILPDVWPPRSREELDPSPIRIPYLEAPPEVIDISTGNQLFVDDFLIEETTLQKRWHSAAFRSDSPFLRPETKQEISGGIAPLAAPFTDGCWFDPLDGLYKLWYHGGWMDGICLAVSEDTKTWYRKRLEARPGTNVVWQAPEGWHRDGTTVILDPHASKLSERWKLFTFYRTPDGEHAQVQVSRDGMHWSDPVRTGRCGDNSSIFYNPFRRKWVFSIRRGISGEGTGLRYSRARWYYECDDIMSEAAWKEGEEVFWERCDELDRLCSEPGTTYSKALPPQLYHLNCAPYESLMLGMFGIIKDFDWYDNGVPENGGFPKHLDLHIGFSRDGFHFSRDYRAPFIKSSGEPGTWNRGYLHACGGLYLDMGDELLFPVGGFSGESPVNGGTLYAGASTGMAVLRKDGFASMHAEYSKQTLLTRPVTFAEGTSLFVNAEALRGFAGAEITDLTGKPYEGFSFEDCIPAQGNGVKQELRFTGGSIAQFAGKPIRLRFHLIGGDLYSFSIK